MLFRPYHIAYLSFSYVSISETTMSYAYIGNRDGFNKSDPVQGVISAIQQTNIEANLTASLIDLPGQFTYPASR